MKIIGRILLDKFMRKHSTTKGWISNWVADTEEVTWRTPNDIKRRYASASFISDRVVIFNIKGNSYRMEVQVAFQTQIVEVLWLGTHSEYDERNKRR